MIGFIEGERRNQATLFPERIDDDITEDSAVRVIDVFVSADVKERRTSGCRNQSANWARRIGLRRACQTNLGHMDQ